jgi:hypothetical protein
MSPDVLQYVLRRLDSSEEAMLDGDELAAWPDGEVKELVALGLLAEAPLAGTVSCDGCEEGCLELVEWVGAQGAAPRRAFVVCRYRDDIGLVRIDPGRLRRYAVHLPGLARVLADTLGTTRAPTELIAGRLWGLGSRDAKQRRVDLFLARGMAWRDAPELFANVPAITECSTPLVLVPHDPPTPAAKPRGATIVSLSRLAPSTGGAFALDAEELFSVLGARRRVQTDMVVPLPVPEGTRWGQVLIEFASDEVARITVGLEEDHRTFGEMGFANLGVYGHPPSGLWDYLRRLADWHGEVPESEVARLGITNLQKRISDLRRQLKLLLPGILGDPIPYSRRSGCYRAAFAIQPRVGRRIPRP